jgi:hypothetical protein
MKFYRMTETASAQIQAVGVSIQIGSRIWGAAPDSWYEPGGRRKGGTRFFGRIIFMAPEDQRGLRVSFELRTPWFTMKRIGKASADHDQSSVGWYFARQMCSGVNV